LSDSSVDGEMLRRWCALWKKSQECPPPCPGRGWPTGRHIIRTDPDRQ